MELFAVVADMLGEGLPLSYLFITTEENAAPLTKQNALIVWMNSIRSLGIDPRFTLSDKDQSEINTLKEVWPDAKHQLCLWHILRALRRDTRRHIRNNTTPSPPYVSSCVSSVSPCASCMTSVRLCLLYDVCAFVSCMTYCLCMYL